MFDNSVNSNNKIVNMVKTVTLFKKQQLNLINIGM